MKHANDGEEQETGKCWGRAIGRQVMGESKRQASDGENKRESNRQIMEKSKRHASDGAE
jgi:hypothetical protein